MIGLFIYKMSLMHVETVCLLSKLHADQNIEVEFQMDELDLVKQKCRIIERENYNKSKPGNARQLRCPLEKELAIKDALEQFGMV